ncbi:MAG: hypothetical protein FWE21_00600 [Defluviitaleaceae bacterium]|nr:hypothetical protein [Defluviitaleaceae bacterium]
MRGFANNLVGFGLAVTLATLLILMFLNFENPNIPKLFAVFFGLVPICAGAVLIIIGKIDERKLKRLKAEGITIVPEKTIVICSFSYGHTMGLKENLYAAFRVKCLILTKNGKMAPGWQSS